MNFLLLFLVLMPIFGAFLSYLAGRNSKSLRDHLVLGLTALELLGALSLVFTGELSLVLPDVCGLGLSFRADGFRTVMAVLASTAWFMAAMPSRWYFAHAKNRNRYYLFFLFVLGSTMGVFLSDDLYTTFVFFEMMSFSSYVWVVQEETDGAIKASESFLGIGVIGGLVALMGVFLLYHLTGDLSFVTLRESCAAVENRRLLYAAGGCLLFGFGAKAGMFPLHFWLPTAHPVAPSPASAVLSGVITKAGIFGVLVLGGKVFFHDSAWGLLILLLGTVTMLLGAVLGIFSVNLKRTLACSSMSQIGFVLVGIGMQGLLGHHNQLAVFGTVLHMINHSLIKLVLFISAGVVLENVNSLDLNTIRGWGRDKHLLKGCFLTGALTIGGIPLLSGYVSKTLLHESIVEYVAELSSHGEATALFSAIEWLFLLAGGMTLAYMTKLFVCIFVEKPQKEHPSHGTYMDKRTAVMLVSVSAALLLMGLTPHLTMDRIADFARDFVGGEAAAHQVHYFAWVNLKGAVISLLIGAALYFGVVRTLLMKKNAQGEKEYVNRWPSWADLEKNIYRPILALLAFVGAMISRTAASLADWTVALIHRVFYKKAPQTVEPRTNELFGAYSEKPVHRGLVGETLEYELLLYGVGVVITLLYLFLR